MRPEAPVIAMRMIAGVAFRDTLPDCEVQLGTTRGTNALLTRTGSRTAFVTTAGMTDLLTIGDQARPDLFAIDIRKRDPLFEQAIGIDERVLADGSVERSPNVAAVGRQLQRLRNDGIEAIELLETEGGPQPDLILLDLNMPRMGGHEFLNTYYADSDHECPVVMMLTSSNREEDRQLTEAFACVRHYFSKPIDRATVQGLADWLERTARAP